MQETLLLINVVLAAIGLVLLLFVAFHNPRGGWAQLEAAVGRVDASVRDEFFRGREESGKDAQALREELARRLHEANADAERGSKELRDELHAILRTFGDAMGARTAELSGVQGGKLDAVATQIQTLTDGNERRQEALRTNVESKLGELKAEAARSAKELREEVAASLKGAGEALTQSVDQISRTQRERLDALSQAVAALASRVSSIGSRFRPTPKRYRADRNR